MTALNARAGFHSHQWFVGKEALTKLSERVTFTVKAFLNFSSRNILKFSLVQNLLHIRENYFIQNRLVIEAVLLTSIPFHTTISIPFVPLLQFFGNL